MSNNVTPSNTASQPTWSLAISWLDECVATHSKCLTSTGKVPWQPSRLVDVGADETSKVRLRIGKDQSTQQYVTLSHCWGKIEIMRLLNDNLKAMTEEIRVSELPKTFQDAIAITRRLHIRFIWIDSLCIIQNSLEDWLHESATMEDVYKNSYLNIAATGASDGNGGCFVERNPLLVQPCRVDVSWAWSPGTHYLYDSALWRLGMTRAPLNTRAWVVQERILSPRILHFGLDQIYWECNEKNSCETFPGGVPISMIDLEPRFKSQSPAIDGTRLRCFSEEWYGLLKVDPALNPYDLWSNIVAAYTRCNLTKWTDKLVAIFGVAKHIQRIIDDQYLAGLWKRHLPYHLLWYKERPSSIPMDWSDENYRAPSWSWASVDGEITDHPISHIEGERTLIDTLDAQVVNIGPDAFGPVLSGFIKLRGLLKPASWLWLEDDELFTLVLDSENANDSYAFPDYMEMSTQSSVFCLPVHTFDLEPGEPRTYGLVLEETHEDGVFRRVGQFKVEFDDCKYFDKELLQERVITII